MDRDWVQAGNSDLRKSTSKSQNLISRLSLRQRNNYAFKQESKWVIFLPFWGPVICPLANPEMRLNLCLTKEAPEREGERHRDRQRKLCRGCWVFFFLFCLLGRILPLCLRGAVCPPENMTLYFLPLFVNTPHYHPSQFHVTASRH